MILLEPNTYSAQIIFTKHRFPNINKVSFSVGKNFPQCVDQRTLYCNLD
jgi:hypothetical protein